MELVPPHRTYINFLINKGTIDHYAVSMETQRSWITLNAASKKEVEKILKKFNVPLELKVLMALESGFNATAKSGAGAYGYWQFMEAAARQYGLNIVNPKDTSAVRLKKKDDRRKMPNAWTWNRRQEKKRRNAN